MTERLGASYVEVQDMSGMDSCIILFPQSPDVIFLLRWVGCDDADSLFQAAAANPLRL